MASRDGKTGKHGLRVLYDAVTEGKQALVDIIAVHGIGANPDRAWNAGDINWLRERRMLPSAVPHSRIACFGYESSWFGRDAIQQRLPLVAEQLLISLKGLRGSTDLRRPLVFIGHCFGGLVAEKAVLTAKLHEYDYLGIFQSFCGLVTLATPHRGSGMQPIGSLIASIASSVGYAEKRNLIKYTREDSETLADMVHDFARLAIAESIPIFCFFELRKADVARLVRPKRLGWPVLEEFVVNEESGCIVGFPRLGIPLDHFRIHRYASAEDPNFLYIRDQIVQIVTQATQGSVKTIQNSRPTESSSGDFVGTSSTPIEDIAAPYPFNERDQASLNCIFITDPCDDLQRIANQKDALIDGSISWILQDPGFARWLQEKGSQTLWIHGDPGKGKTMIAISLIKHFQQLVKRQTNSTLCFFFCDSENNRQNSAASILRGLIYQFLCQHPQLVRVLRGEYERQGEYLTNSPNSIHSLWRILHGIVAASNLNEIFIVVDALDECSGESMEELLTILQPYSQDYRRGSLSNKLNMSSKHDSRIRWILTSRNEDIFHLYLGRSWNISLEKNFSRVEKAVHMFVDLRVRQLQKVKRYDSALREYVEITLRQKAEGTFLWVSLACEELARPKVRAIQTKSILSKLPSGITSLYSKILEQILESEDEVGSETLKLIKAILRAMALACRPLKLEEIAVVADLPLEYRGNDSAIEDLVSLCGSLVTTRQRAVHFVHLSAKTYIASLSPISPQNVKEEHASIAIRCLDFVSSSWVQTLVKDRQFLLRQMQEGNDIHYTSLYWPEHAREAEEHFSNLVRLDSNFFRNRHACQEVWFNLYWAEHHAKWEIKPQVMAPFLLSSYCELPHLAARLLGSMTSPIASPVLDQVDSSGNSALVWATKKGSLSLVILLLEHHADINLANSNGETATYWAASNGNIKILQLLADRGANAQRCDKAGWTPLHRAAHNGYPQIVRVLVGCEVNIEARDCTSWTALQRAASGGQIDVMLELLEHHAIVEVRDREGMTPLATAAWNGHTGILDALIDRGADLDAADHEGWTPLHHACWTGNYEVASLLIDKGALINCKNHEGCTPLFQAVWNGHLAVVQLLLLHGAGVNVTCYNGETALQQAAWEGHGSVLKLLIEAGADINAMTEDGVTALHQASSNGQEEVVALLLRSGADSALVDTQGQTAYENAKENSYETTASLLKVESSPVKIDPEIDVIPSKAVPLDSAVGTILNINPSSATVTRHGNACSSQSWKITFREECRTSSYFLKTGPEGQMYKGEQASLQAMKAIVPTLCPRALGHGKLSESAEFFLLTEFINVKDQRLPSKDRLSFAAKLAKLHSAPAPLLSRSALSMFGFHCKTYAGPIPQDNEWKSSWSDFYANNRLRHVSSILAAKHHGEDDLLAKVEEIADKVVPKLLGSGHLGGERGISSALVHGDLWSANKARGVINDEDGFQDYAFDASCCYAHSEFDLALMRMFGGFSAGFFSEYHRLIAKTEPQGEYDDRMELYKLYHWLVNYAISGGGFKEDAMNCIQRLKHHLPPEPSPQG